MQFANVSFKADKSAELSTWLPDLVARPDDEPPRPGSGRGVCWVLGSVSWLLHRAPGGLLGRLEAEGHSVTAIVLSSRGRGELGLGPADRLAATWDQVGGAGCRWWSIQVEEQAEAVARTGVRSFWNVCWRRKCCISFSS
jgi:hypothetical protein